MFGLYIKRGEMFSMTKGKWINSMVKLVMQLMLYTIINVICTFTNIEVHLVSQMQVIIIQSRLLNVKQGVDRISYYFEPGFAVDNPFII